MRKALVAATFRRSAETRPFASLTSTLPQEGDSTRNLCVPTDHSVCTAFERDLLVGTGIEDLNVQLRSKSGTHHSTKLRKVVMRELEGAYTIANCEC